jgi:hypothetical protein
MARAIASNCWAARVRWSSWSRVMSRSLPVYRPFVDFRIGPELASDWVASGGIYFPKTRCNLWSCPLIYG